MKHKKFDTDQFKIIRNRYELITNKLIKASFFIYRNKSFWNPWFIVCKYAVMSFKLMQYHQTELTIFISVYEDCLKHTKNIGVFCNILNAYHCVLNRHSISITSGRQLPISQGSKSTKSRFKVSISFIGCTWQLNFKRLGQHATKPKMSSALSEFSVRLSQSSWIPVQYSREYILLTLVSTCQLKQRLSCTKTNLSHSHTINIHTAVQINV